MSVYQSLCYTTRYLVTDTKSLFHVRESVLMEHDEERDGLTQQGLLRCRFHSVLIDPHGIEVNVNDQIEYRLYSFPLKDMCSLSYPLVSEVNQESLHSKLPHIISKIQCTSSNAKVQLIEEDNHLKCFQWISNRYGACESIDSATMAKVKVKEAHEVIQRSKLKQVKDQDQVIHIKF
ncbi:hypothetical protein Tco_1304271 [Tanacetum coccineum]